MAKLPKLEFSFNFVPKEGVLAVPIVYRPYNSEDEKFLLLKMAEIRSNKAFDPNIVSYINDFIDRCITNKSEAVDTVIKNMSYINKLWLFFMIRSKSKSNNVALPVVCDECGSIIPDTSFDIEKDIKLSSDFAGRVISVSLPDDSILQFALKVPTMEVLSLAFEIKDAAGRVEGAVADDSQNASVAAGKTPVNTMATDIVTLFNKLDEVVFEFTKHVVRTYADKQKQPDMYDEFDMDDFRVFMKSIPGGSKEMLKKIFDDLPQFVVNKTFKCTNKVKVETKMDAAAIHAATTVDAPKLPEFKLCGHEQTVQIEGIFNFFL